MQNIHDVAAVATTRKRRRFSEYKFSAFDKVESEIYHFLHRELRLLRILNKDTHTQSALLTFCHGAKRKFERGKFLWAIKYLEEIRNRNLNAMRELMGELEPIEVDEFPQYMKELHVENERITSWLLWLEEHQL